MNAALKIAQLNHDNRLPDEEYGFLESEEGQEWLERSMSLLMAGKPVMKPNPIGRDIVLVTEKALIESVADHVSGVFDERFSIERILIEIMRRGHKDDKLYQLACMALGVTEGQCKVVQDLALAILSTVAEEYAEAAREEDRVQSECGF